MRCQMWAAGANVPRPVNNHLLSPRSPFVKKERVEVSGKSAYERFLSGFVRACTSGLRGHSRNGCRLSGSIDHARWPVPR
jgi:hypothetical protein